MALDDALLQSVAEDPSAAVFRTYRWSVPTLSLGYFQAWSRIEADSQWSRVPIVRRPTGGGAIWHEHEVTYALILPRSDARTRQAPALYRTVHAAMIDLLQCAGIDARRRGEEGPGPGGPQPVLCFTDRDPEDVVVAGRKVVGSAQRRHRGAVLQHGSLLVAGSARTPELPGLRELAGTPILPAAWSRVIQARLPAALGLQAHPSTPTPDELARAADLERACYRNPAWNRRR